MTSRANPEHWPRLLKLIGREDLIGDERYATPDARLQREAEVDAIVTGWTKERTKQEAMAQLSAVGVPAGAVLDTQELIDEPSFYKRGILQKMTHGERKMVMPTWPVRFDGVPTKVQPAPLPGPCRRLAVSRRRLRFRPVVECDPSRYAGRPRPPAGRDLARVAACRAAAGDGALDPRCELRHWPRDRTRDKPAAEVRREAPHPKPVAATTLAVNSSKRRRR